MAGDEETGRKDDLVEMPDGTLKRRPRRAYAALLGLLFFGTASTVLFLYGENIRDWGGLPDAAFVHVCGFLMGIVALLFLVNVALIFARVGWIGRTVVTLFVLGAVIAFVATAFQSGKWERFGLHFDGDLRPSFRWGRALEDLPGVLAGEPARPVGSEIAPGEQVGDAVGDNEDPAEAALAGEPEWPGFLGPNRDGVASDPGLVVDWEASPPELLWKRDVGEGWSSFAVWGDRFYTQEQRGEKEYVVCYALATGEPIWAVFREARHAEALGGVGPRATPTLANGRVYAAGATGLLLCLDALTGAEVWSVDVREIVGVSEADDLAVVSWGRSASPLVSEGRVYITGGGADAKQSLLLCLDALTGDVVWKGGDDQISYVSPQRFVIDGVSQILAIGENKIFGFEEKSGDILWSFPWRGSSSGDATCSQPHLLSGQRVLISKGYGYGAACFRVARVETQASGGRQSPEADGRGQETSTERVEDQRVKDEWIADELWANKRVLRTKFSNLVVAGDHAYGLSDGVLECVAVETGEQLWRDGRYGHGQILLVGQVLLVQGEQGEVAIVEATPDEFRERARIEALEGKTWNNPVLVGDTLLVRNSSQMAAYRLPTK